MGKIVSLMAGAALFAAATSPAYSAEAVQKNAGKLADGSEATEIILTGKNGVSVTVLSFGATLHKFMAPDRNGKLADIAVSYENLSDYEKRPNYWGATIGRYGNRIGGGKFVLDNQSYQLSQNNGKNSLHGGAASWDVRNWKVEMVTSGTIASVRLSLYSPDGDNGYPGAVNANVTYSLDDAGALTIEFAATTNKPTVINMTNHALFNMAGEGAPQGAMDNILTIPASHYTPVDENLIPTGELRAVEGSVFDFRKGKTLNQGLRDGTDQQIAFGRGFDHNFALDKGVTDKPELAARLEDPQSGRVLEVLSTQPGLQLYAGNFLDGTYLGKNGHLYRMGDGIALEPQKFPDAPNHPNFVQARVDPGQTYRHVMIYRVSVNR